MGCNSTTHHICTKGLLLFKTKGPDCENIGLGCDLGTIGAWHLDFRDDCSLGIEHITSSLHSGLHAMLIYLVTHCTHFVC